jgi:hypothetical protein
MEFSASKTVFIMIAATACFSFGKGILPVDQFMILAIGVFQYYFQRKN